MLNFNKYFIFVLILLSLNAIAMDDVEKKDSKATAENNEQWQSNGQKIIEAIKSFKNESSEAHRLCMLKCIRELVNEANVNAKDKDGMTALMCASRYGHKEVVEILIQASVDINAKGEKDWTALSWAINDGQYGHTEIVEILIAAGADINEKALENIRAMIVILQFKDDFWRDDDPLKRDKSLDFFKELLSKYEKNDSIISLYC